jgi:hypothetical protein
VVPGHRDADVRQHLTALGVLVRASWWLWWAAYISPAYAAISPRTCPHWRLRLIALSSPRPLSVLSGRRPPLPQAGQVSGLRKGAQGVMVDRACVV